ncbi:MAG: hypothetical protein LQ352_000205 [Teloschistes flavicans]|nr:MAG: hypothetical protein LQ352_000205 [Teloschistes flavicans]
MLPTLAVHGDTTWTSSRYRHGKGIAVGDLVLFKHPYVVGVEAIKRVVGMPGDFVMRDVHDEGGSQVMLQVPQGHCWRQGVRKEYIVARFQNAEEQFGAAGSGQLMESLS